MVLIHTGQRTVALRRRSSRNASASKSALPPGGRVLGISTALSYILIPLSLVLAGAISELWPPFVLPLASGLTLIAALSVLYLIERRAERAPAQENV